MIAETDGKKNAEAKHARLAQVWELRDAAIAAGMETWSADRIADEVRKIRDGEES